MSRFYGSLCTLHIYQIVVLQQIYITILTLLSKLCYPTFTHFYSDLTCLRVFTFSRLHHLWLPSNEWRHTDVTPSVI